MIGKTIHNYQIKGLLEKGGMGNVYISEHTKLRNKKAAVKFLHINLDNRPDLKKRFEKEAQTLDLLKHKNIVKIIDYGEFENRHYLITEFIEGQTLDKYISHSSGPIPEPKAIRIFKQILDALDYSHSKNVIHRDIKPSNVIITPEQNVVIIDFGIAKSIQESQNINLTGEGERPGTVPYMSPEQIAGEKIGKLTDIYSLGVLLFQMVTGRHPYPDGKSVFSIHSKIVKEPLDRIQDIYPHCSDTMQQIIDKATAKQTQKRYASCREFYNALGYDSSIVTDKTKTKIQENRTQAEQPEKNIVVKPDNKTQSERSTQIYPKDKKSLNKTVVLSVLFILVVAGSFYFVGDFDFVDTNPGTTVLNPNSGNAVENANEEELLNKGVEKESDQEKKTEIKKEEETKKKDSTLKPRENKTTKKNNPKKNYNTISKTQSLQTNLNKLTSKKYSISEKNRFTDELLNDFTGNAIIEITNNNIVTERFPIKEYLNNLKMLPGMQIIVIEKEYGNHSKISLVKLTEK